MNEIVFLSFFLFSVRSNKKKKKEKNKRKKKLILGLLFNFFFSLTFFTLYKDLVKYQVFQIMRAITVHSILKVSNITIMFLTLSRLL